MDNQRVQIIERLKQANNILVTVSNSPSVDQLAACIGLTLALNKAGKHATAVFSGNIPSTLEFLQPEKTIEKNTDSLQDFIIALDKSKADKLRYKVEDRVVKIFITPYRSSINQNDLEFSQGDFNVDAVLAIGVHSQGELDHVITAHGRILHDATVMCVNIAPGGDLGSINWLEPAASSLSELSVHIINGLDQKLIDGQIATAFLTGIVAETDRFSNQRTAPQTMSVSAQLMAAGANQQLVATKLEEPAPAPQTPLYESEAGGLQHPGEQAQSPTLPLPPPKKPEDGTIEIPHDENKPPEPTPALPQEAEQEDSLAPQIHIDEQGQLIRPKEETPEAELPPIKREREDSSHMITEPPTFGTPPMTANTTPEKDDEDEASGGFKLPEIGLLNREPLPGQAQPEDKPQDDTHARFEPPHPPGTTFNPQAFGAQEVETSAPTGPTAMPSAGLMPPPTTVQPTVPSESKPADVTQNDTEDDEDEEDQDQIGSNPAIVGSTVSPQLSPAAAEDASKTLSQIEQDVNSPHLSGATEPAASSQPAPALPAFDLQPPASSGQSSIALPGEPVIQPLSAQSEPAPDVSNARDAVAEALGSANNQPLEPIQALNAQPLSDSLNTAQPAPAPQPAMPASPPPFSVPSPTYGTPGQPPASPPPMMPPAYPPQV